MFILEMLVFIILFSILEVLSITFSSELYF